MKNYLNKWRCTMSMEWMTRYTKDINFSQIHVAVCMLSCFSHVQLCDPIQFSPPGSSIHGILLARILEWVPFPTPGNLPKLWIKPMSLMSPALAGRFFTLAPPGKPSYMCMCLCVLSCFSYVQLCVTYMCNWTELL